jgi:diguanylate cyclase (GGDEF)-like protein
VINVAITIELLCLFMGTSTQQISMDKLTQVNNRQNLLGFLDYKLLNHDEKIFLLMMDLDYFKTINDTYGHLEGDDALIRAAQALKIACGDFKRRPYIARYGGDEFIVVIESSKPEAEALIACIRETLSCLNDQAKRPYTLAFSIGVGEYHSGMNANDLIEAADHALYEIKRARPPRPR